ncbi:MAG TPA: DUF1080 domain-containing protein [Armatimonadota bacterium]|nr:DUF1080 domain-containing protein [Armatimonadota bacterium]
MIRSVIGLVSLLLAVAACAAEKPEAAPEKGPDGSLILFNGKDLKGWDGDPKFWSVRDGAITGATTPENVTPSNTFLIWRGGTLKDFELNLKFRIKGGNSGIQYRSKDLGNWVVSGYQADFEDGETFTGIVYEERGRGVLANVGEKTTVGAEGKPRKTGTVGEVKTIQALHRRGEWNDYRITARGNHLVHAINGTVTAESTDEDEARRAMEGILALQLHQGPPMVVQFKDIRLKVLDGKSGR